MKEFRLLTNNFERPGNNCALRIKLLITVSCWRLEFILVIKGKWCITDNWTDNWRSWSWSIRTKNESEVEEKSMDSFIILFSCFIISFVLSLSSQSNHIFSCSWISGYYDFIMSWPLMFWLNISNVLNNIWVNKVLIQGESTILNSGGTI